MRKKCVCTFILFFTKAVQLEIAHALTTAAFLASLKSFIDRRGNLREACCDKSRNFVGIYNEIKNILKSLFKCKSKKETENYTDSEGI